MKTISIKILMRSFSAVAVMWILCVLTAISVKAQSEMIFTQHWALPTLYNPARTGDTDFLRIRGGARLQWIGVTHAPQSFVATGDMPFLIGRKRIGAGASFSQESIGLCSNLLVSVQGSYKLKILKGQLGIGVQVGYYNSRFR
ncbi:MAG: type IX secretion system membrane protein PorP/SprF, partial [Muribaculaceae bacterium]|nr:type IX secretion system membrane protein PorP/SprF [Muribaculaceae bacterium]